MNKLVKNKFLLLALIVTFSIFNLNISNSSSDSDTKLRFLNQIANAGWEDLEPLLCDCGKDMYNYDDLYLFLFCTCSYNQYDCCACCTYM